MAKHLEKRACKRFDVEGATLQIKRRRRFKAEEYAEAECPVVNLSKGGVMFINNAIALREGDAVSVLLKIRNEEDLELTGRVKWTVVPGSPLGSSVGVHFDPFGEGKDMNSADRLERLSRLEEQSG